MAGLAALLDSIGDDFARAVEAVYACKGRVVVTGVGKSGHIGQKIAATLSSTGTPAYFVHASEAAHGDLGLVGDDDIVLAISNSGETVELSAIMRYCRRFEVQLIVITSQPGSTLAGFADLALILPAAREACPLKLAPTTSTTLTLVLGDALAMALMSKRGFSSEQFARFHPGGRLGAQLVRISELLEREPSFGRVPRVSQDDGMDQVVATITAGGLGFAAVADGTGRIIGIITDGDLRRALADRGFFERRAAEIMTRDPKSIGSDRIAAEALAICEEHKISVLFVNDEQGRVIGLLHLKDLLRLGTA
ncbi:MAG: KpsF/GutQ family sugar-phosphate isomerase [Rhizobiaceae bacterium]|nr:KpsF/GutQ family sugar-phosphate isomerase [Rhizobiaceae bacterium]MCV0405585.1 KpsF/GutQ family sugar-phosphate isomerase [Rhizobiaceae bacterium]